MTDVIIVGAGPVGLSLALGLARAGKSVIILEKDPGLHTTSRAPVIWPRTQEILADLGALSVIEASSIVMSRFTIWDADTDRMLLQLSFDELKDKTAFPRVLVLPQHKTEALLHEVLKNYPSVQVQFGAELTGIEQGPDAVRVQYLKEGQGSHELAAAYVVGCDGGHSAVRAALGLKLDGITYPFNVALADVRVKSDDDTMSFPRFSARGVPVVAVRIAPGEWRLILFLGNKETMTLDERIRRAVNQVFKQSEFELLWKSEFKIHRRICAQFAKGRVALAGDAAHLNSPVGGQGMNSGIQDGALLCGALVQAMNTSDPAVLIPNAELRRKKINFGVNRFTNYMTRVVMLSNGRYMGWVFRVMNLLFKVSFFRKKILLKLTMLEDEAR